MTTVSCKSHVRDYCSRCSFAGLRYIADDTKHWTERWLWVVLVALAWYGSALLIFAAWDAFVTNPISCVVETTYTDWDTKMPSTAVCEHANYDKIYEVADALWTKDHLLDLEEALNNIAYFRGFAYDLINVCSTSKTIDPRCPLSNYSYYAQLVRSKCSEFLKNCSYNGEDFDCCEYFYPIETDVGICYIINSIQTENAKHYPMISNMKHKTNVLKFQVSSISMMYTLGEDEVPSITTLYSSTLKLKLGYIYRRQVTVRNIENDPLLVETSQQQRACRFHDENEDGLYPHYSYSACNVLCRKRAQLELCHCNDHFMPGTTESERCNISGMSCLHSLANHLIILKPRWAVRPGLSCGCLPSCDETEITVLRDVVTKLKPKRDTSYVELVLVHPPTERFKRNVVRSHLDLVVSVGGTAGLFVGASLLSFVELIFFFTVRFICNLWAVKRKHNKNVAEIRILKRNANEIHK